MFLSFFFFFFTRRWRVRERDREMEDERDDKKKSGPGGMWIQGMRKIEKRRNRDRRGGEAVNDVQRNEVF